MSTHFRLLLGSIMSAALIAGCALEVAEQEEPDLGTTQSELLLRPRPLPPPNPCFVTSCPAATTCEVQEGAAVCVPRGGLLP